VAATVGGAVIPFRLRLRRREQGIVLAVAGLVLCVAALLPLVALAAELLSVGTDGLRLWAERRTWVLLGRSLLLSGVVTAVALAIGIPLGVLFGRTDVPGRHLAWLLHAFPMFLPPFLLALGWFHLFGRQGFLGGDATARVLFSEFGLIALLGLTFAPAVTSLVALGVLGVDPSLEEAARTTARPWRVATRILLPAAWPAVALAAVVVSALAFSELGVPMFLRVEVFQTAVFARLGGVDYAPGEAIALLLPLVPVSIALLGLEAWLAGRRSFEVLGMRVRSRLPLPLRRWRLPASIVCWLAALFSIAPVLSLAARAAWGGGFRAASQWLRLAPINGLIAATASACIILFVGVVVGHAVARRSRAARWFDALAVLAFVTPASVLGVGIIAVWNRTATQIVYGTLAILVVGFVARYSVVGVRVFASVVAQTPAHLEAAAAAAGVGYGRRLARIVLPLGARGAAFAWLLAFVFCLRDLETAVLYYPPGREPLTVRIFTLEANGPEPVVAALGVLHVGITATVAAVGFLLLRRKAPA